MLPFWSLLLLLFLLAATSSNLKAAVACIPGTLNRLRTQKAAGRLPNVPYAPFSHSRCPPSWLAAHRLAVVQAEEKRRSGKMHRAYIFIKPSLHVGLSLSDNVYYPPIWKCTQDHRKEVGCILCTDDPDTCGTTGGLSTLVMQSWGALHQLIKGQELSLVLTLIPDLLLQDWFYSLRCFLVLKEDGKQSPASDDAQLIIDKLAAGTEIKQRQGINHCDCHCNSLLYKFYLQLQFPFFYSPKSKAFELIIYRLPQTTQ